VAKLARQREPFLLWILCGGAVILALSLLLSLLLH